MRDLCNPEIASLDEQDPAERCKDYREEERNVQMCRVAERFDIRTDHSR